MKKEKMINLSDPKIIVTEVVITKFSGYCTRKWGESTKKYWGEQKLGEGPVK